LIYRPKSWDQQGDRQKCCRVISKEKQMHVPLPRSAKSHTLSPHSQANLNLLPDEQDFRVAEKALSGEHVGEIDNTYFQHYVALIATCVQQGDRHVGEIMARVAPIIGAKSASHLAWFIDILTGPAQDVHLWYLEEHEQGMSLYGPAMYLQPALERLVR
jgi:hypothetical protein